MKVGILTHYYKNLNYGGVLQAYALARAINDMGICAEQVCYQMRTRNLEKGGDGKSLKKEIYQAGKILLKRLGFVNNLNHKANEKLISCFDSWCNKNVPHSKKVYDFLNIKKCLNEYDCFVTGSDQVWNYEWYDKNFFLDFARDKKKISYAASVGHTELGEYSKEVFKEHLKDFSAISVRESDLVDILSPLAQTPVEFVADPVFLLNKGQWENLTNERIIDEEYIFCYFLGKDKDMANIAVDYAKENGVKIVTLSQLDRFSKRNDENIIKLENVGPGGFLSLIRNAETVITDSFHAFAFSLIFERQVFVFQKLAEKGMGVRISSLAKLVGCDERFCDTDEKRCVDYLRGLHPIDYSLGFEELEELISSSKRYLEKALGIV